MGIFGAFVIAVIMAFLFSGYRKKNSVMPLVILFLVLFFAGVSAQFWIVPFGPKIWGVNWVPVLLTVVVIALIFSATPPHINYSKTNEPPPISPAGTAIGITIWVIILVLILASVIGYFNSGSLVASNI